MDTVLLILLCILASAVIVGAISNILTRSELRQLNNQVRIVKITFNEVKLICVGELKPDGTFRLNQLYQHKTPVMEIYRTLGEIEAIEEKCANLIKATK